MSADPLASILAAFRREPSRIWSVVITLYGDAIVPRGGSVWLGTLAAFFSVLEVGEGALRTAMSRLAADGWLERTRLGRESFYRLAEKGRATFAEATEHIYFHRPPHWTGGFELLLLEGANGHEKARAALVEAGFGSVGPGLWVAPRGVPIPANVGGAIRLLASTDEEDAARLAASAWPLARMAAAYGRFIESFGPLARSAADLDERGAFVARILLVHAFRRVVLRDPILPAALLPEDWPGEAARSLSGKLYQALLPASEAWLDRHGRNEGGPLPPPPPELHQRFR